MTPLVRGGFLISLTFGLWPTFGLADNACEGRKPVEHDDGRYHFASSSWVRSQYGAVFYGRCIEVLPPTSKLINHWVEVLPRGIAREERPIKGGQSFLDENNESRLAILKYGNSDDQLDASYIAHRDEPKPRADQKAQLDKNRASIEEAINKNGKANLDSFYEFAVEMKEGDPESLADLYIYFGSIFDGKTFYYSLKYEVNFINEKYSNNYLILTFNDKELQNMVKESTGIDAVEAKDGSTYWDYDKYSPGDVNFVSEKLLLLRPGSELVAAMPISYFLPAK